MVPVPGIIRGTRGSYDTKKSNACFYMEPRIRFYEFKNESHKQKGQKGSIFEPQKNLHINRPNAVFEPHVHTNGKPGFFLFLFTQVMSVFQFFGY